jgi:hypothetical protein
VFVRLVLLTKNRLARVSLRAEVIDGHLQILPAAAAPFLPRSTPHSPISNV